jgi:hypothetical protein
MAPRGPAVLQILWIGLASNAVVSIPQDLGESGGGETG